MHRAALGELRPEIISLPPPRNVCRQPRPMHWLVSRPSCCPHYAAPQASARRRYALVLLLHARAAGAARGGQEPLPRGSCCVTRRFGRAVPAASPTTAPARAAPAQHGTRCRRCCRTESPYKQQRVSGLPLGSRVTRALGPLSLLQTMRTQQSRRCLRYQPGPAPAQCLRRSKFPDSHEPLVAPAGGEPRAAPHKLVRAQPQLPFHSCLSGAALAAKRSVDRRGALARCICRQIDTGRIRGGCRR